MTFRVRLLLFIFAGSLISLSILSGIASYRMHRLSEASLAIQKKALLDDYDTLIKGQVHTVISLLASIEERSRKGEMTVEVAKKMAADAVRPLRFQKDLYFWIDTLDGTNVVLMGKPSEGTNRIGLQDKKGKYLVKDIIEVARKEDGGYFDYWFPRGTSEPLPKRGYSLEFKALGLGGWDGKLYR
jgi:methyl-accepting chemotaxis protein